MKITSTTIIFTFCSFAAIFFTFNNLKKDIIGIRSAVIWLLLWFGVGFFSLFPGLLSSAMHLAQMKNRMLFILVMAVFILFAILFNMSSKLDKMQRTSARLIQEIAILRYKMEDREQDSCNEKK